MTENGHWQIFEPLRFRNLKVKNRLFPLELRTLRQLRRLRHGARMDWDVKFARGGIGAIISSNTPVTRAASSSPTTRTSTPTSGSPSTRSWGRVRDASAKYIVQLAFSGASGHAQRALRHGPLLHDRPAGAGFSASG